MINIHASGRPVGVGSLTGFVHSCASLRMGLRGERLVKLLGDVVHLQDGGAPYYGQCLLRVADAGELHTNLPVTLTLDLSLSHTQAVDALHDDADGLVHAFFCARSPHAVLRLQDDGQAALEIQAQLRLLRRRNDEVQGRSQQNSNDHQEHDTTLG